MEGKQPKRGSGESERDGKGEFAEEIEKGGIFGIPEIEIGADDGIESV